MSLAKSVLVVEALVDMNRRYGAIIVSLAEAFEEVLPDVPPEVEERLGRAARDVEAQLAALSDALDTALSDVLEGR